MTTIEKFQQKFWRLIYPIFPYLQRPFAAFHGGRQRYHIGWLAEGRTLEDLKAHLAKQGFGNHFIAWDDTGQVLSWRKFDGFEWQYHVRVFDDGEIRAHYEATPEASPIKHFSEIGEMEKRDEFLRFLGDMVSQTRTPMHLELDPTAKEIESQITFL